ncbi:MAG: malonic semialdehyde reductase [Rickettsiaceae bacterium]|nr:malonic semialdehyde reductase [Rickettsiaceae bacterium]
MKEVNEIFTKSRTCNHYSDKPVDDELLIQIYDILKFGPTSANCCPLRIYFAKSEENKKKIISALMDGNKAKSELAPVIAILAYDESFYLHFPKVFPHVPNFGKMYENDPILSYETALRNSSIQGGYFIMVARSLGLDVGPMSGFDSNKINKDFFEGTSFKVNFVCNLGYKSQDPEYERLPRFDFNEVCQIL